MLNRLYIVIGILAILVLGGGFLIPGWIDWSGYRDRLEALAEAELGTDVIIAGDIDFSLLPQPTMKFGSTIVGPADAPLIQIESLVAEFSLMDFLRDRLTVTQLVLKSPIVSVSIGKSGALEFPITLPQTFDSSKLSIASALIDGGKFRFSDARSNDVWQVENFDGEVKISGVQGPFSLIGTGDFGGDSHSIRINTSALSANSQLQTSVFVRAVDGAYSLGAQGALALGDSPTFNGKVTYRSSPAGANGVEGIRGDFVLESEINVATDKILLSAFVIQPDENRSGTRLTGAAVVQLGQSRSFDAVISGGVVSLAPRDLREQTVHDPYELARILGELPPLFVPPMAGRVGVDISELDLRAFSLRDLRIDATTNGEVWDLSDFTAQLPGDSVMTLTGSLFADNDSTGYEGAFSLHSSRPDALAAMWHPPDSGNPLFGAELNLSADLSFASGELSITNGQLDLSGQSHSFAGQLSLENGGNALITARLKTLDERQSAALLALLPDITQEAGFANTFTSGSLDIAAEGAQVFGLDGRGYSVQMDWDSTGMKFERLVAQDYGGARLVLSGDIGGTLSQPQISGGGRVTLGEDARSGILAMLKERFALGQSFADFSGRLLPFDANVDVSSANETGEQGISINGRAGALDLTLEMVLADGMAQFFRSNFVLDAQMRSTDADALTQQLGLGEFSVLASEGPLDITLRGEGSLASSVDTTIVATRGRDRLGFAGAVLLSDPSVVNGSGLVDFALSDFSPLLEQIGAGGLHVPGLEGSADFSFAGSSSLVLNNLVASAIGTTGASVGGQLSLTKTSHAQLMTGQLQVGVISAQSIVDFIGGPAAQIRGDGIWPDGPIDLGNTARTTRGRIGLSAPGLKFGEVNVADQLGFDLVWDENSIALENIAGTNNSGSIGGRLEVCCTGSSAQKQLSGRFSLSDVAIDGLAPDAVGLNLDGIVTGGVLLDATGASISEMVASLSGEGSFSIRNLDIAKFSPLAFSALVQVGDVTELDADALTSIVAVSLDQGGFTTPELGGAFRIDGGVLRADRLAAQGEVAALLGDFSLDLKDQNISGTWVMSPTILEDPAGLIDENTARISAVLGGTLLEPERTLDLGSMVDAIQVRALEIELARLEELRAEQDARSAAAAQERARLMEIEAQRLAAEADRLAAEQDAHGVSEEAARLSNQRQTLIFNINSDPPPVDANAPAVSTGQ